MTWDGAAAHTHAFLTTIQSNQFLKLLLVFGTPWYESWREVKRSPPFPFICQCLHNNEVRVTYSFLTTHCLIGTTLATQSI